MVMLFRWADVHAIVTKGRGDDEMWVEQYMMSYSRDCWIWSIYSEPYGQPKVIVCEVEYCLGTTSK